MAYTDEEIWNTDLFDFFGLQHVSSVDKLAFSYRFGAEITLAAGTRALSSLLQADQEQFSRMFWKTPSTDMATLFEGSGVDLEYEAQVLTMRIKRMLISMPRSYATLEDLELAAMAFLPPQKIDPFNSCLMYQIQLLGYIDMLNLSDDRKDRLIQVICSELMDKALAHTGLTFSSTLTAGLLSVNSGTDLLEIYELFQENKVPKPQQDRLLEQLAAGLRSQLHMLQREIAFLVVCVSHSPA